MGKIYSLITALLLVVGIARGATPGGYEWWFDSDVGSVRSGELSGTSVDLDIPTSSLSKGIHFFNLRLSDTEGQYGTVYRKMFLTYGADKGALSVEYWFDDDHASAQVAGIENGDNMLDIDVASLPKGVHFFNCRASYGDGSWGTVYRKMFINIGGQKADATAYEYWLDNKYASKTEGSITAGDQVFTVDLEGVRKGLHRFNYRMSTGDRTWGSVFTKYFYIGSGENRFTEYEYWLDTDYASRQSASVSSNPVSFEVDLAGFDKSAGPHFFNLRARDGDGEWSSVYRRLIVFGSSDGRVPVIGYRHYINGRSLGYVDMERTLTDALAFEVELPDSLSGGVRGKTLVFDGDHVSLPAADSLDYMLQYRTELGWAAPQRWSLSMPDGCSTIAVDVAVNSSRTFSTPAYGNFVAVKFRAGTVPLYFRADRPVAFDIYKDGKIAAEIPAGRMADIAELSLDAGEYFGILYDVEGEGDRFTFHLMDTPNTVPTPKITFEDGKVDITCSRADAKMRYTLDGSDPTMESALFEAPFGLDHNAVIKAFAYVPDSDITPSSIDSLVVDIYKVATPTGEYDPGTHRLTLKCATDGASISYRIGTDGTWQAYSTPIEIERNCTVYARATKAGYNDSELYEMAIDAFRVPAPEHVFNPETRMLGLRSSTPGAAISYRIDGGAWQTYTDSVRIRRNCTVGAFAALAGYNNSDTVSIEITELPDRVPQPRITFADGMVEITCSRTDAEIHYTLDGLTEPTMDSPLYREPFALTENTTVMAIAYMPDSDIPASEVESLVVDVYKVSTPTGEYDPGTHRLTLTCATDGASISYRIGTDGTWQAYSTPIEIERNCTVYARATKAGYNDSELYEIAIDVFKVSAPEHDFNADTRMLGLRSSTPGAAISYRIDGGAWQTYTDSVRIRRNCTVGAFAALAGYNNSDTVSIEITELPERVPKPRISFADGMVEITCSRTDAEIHYTVDGLTEPTMDSPLYTGGFALTENTTVMAIAYMPDSDIPASEIATYEVGAYVTPAPDIKFDYSTHLLTITCEKIDATISYAFSPEGEWIGYTEPVAIDDKATIYARATFPGYRDSDIKEYEIFRCDPVEIGFNGRYATITRTVDDPETTIMYSLDGSYPAQVYTAPVDVMGLSKVRAIAVRSEHIDSEIAGFDVTGYADERHAVTAAGGLLESCYGWDEDGSVVATIQSLSLEGTLDDADYAFVRSMGALRHLDIEKVGEARIPDGAFAGTGIIDISMPAEIASHGTGILAGCGRLSAVIWNSASEAAGTWLTADIDNPNALIYTESGMQVEEAGRLNVVADGRAAEVKLRHGYPFHAPRPFQAGKVALTREFSLPTVVNECGGWETITLPFAPDSIYHATSGPITPFAAWDGDTAGKKPFWLYASTSDGWTEAEAIEARVPYIISMPNSPDYVASFNLAGTVTFSASGVTLGPDSCEPVTTDWKEGTVLRGTFMPVDADDVLALNVHEAADGMLRGSAFVDSEAAAPFEAYVAEAAGRRAMPVFDIVDHLKLPLTVAAGLTVDSPSHGKIRIISRSDRRVDVLTVDGMLVRTVQVKAGECVIVDDLLRGFYICGGEKVMVK